MIVLARACALALVATYGVVPAAAQPPRGTATAPDLAERIAAGAVRAGADRHYAELVAARRTAAAPDDNFYDSAHVIDAGDLTGDGRPDVLDIRIEGVPDEENGLWAYRYTTTVDAHRGTDGSLLWSRTFAQDERVFVVPGRFGAAAKPGVVFLAYTYEGQYAGTPAAIGAASASPLRLTAVDGGGTELWHRAFASHQHGLLTPVSYNFGELLTFVGGSGNLRGTAATDLLVQVDAYALAGGTAASRVRLAVVDGADGTVADSGVSMESEYGWIESTTGPDLNGDKYDDVVAIRHSRSDELTAFASSGGAALWSAKVQKSWFSDVATMGDVTGDGVPDLAYSVYALDESGWLGTLVDGRSGAARWTRVGKLYPAGGGRRDLLVLQRGVTGPASVGVESLDAAGRRRWRVVRSVPVPKRARVQSLSVHTAGDVSGDSVTDVSYEIVVQPERGPLRRDQGWVDGASGRVHPVTAAGLDYVGGQPVDGRGTDAVDVRVSRGVLTTAVHDGSTGSLVWRAGVSLPPAYVGAWPVIASRLSSGRCADLVVTAVGRTRAVVTVAISAQGEPLWQLTRDGGSGPPAVSRPAARGRVDRNACR